MIVPNVIRLGELEYCFVICIEEASSTPMFGISDGKEGLLQCVVDTYKDLSENEVSNFLEALLVLDVPETSTFHFAIEGFLSVVLGVSMEYCLSEEGKIRFRTPDDIDFGFYAVEDNKAIAILLHPDIEKTVFFEVHSLDQLNLIRFNDPTINSGVIQILTDHQEQMNLPDKSKKTPLVLKGAFAALMEYLVTVFYENNLGVDVSNQDSFVFSDGMTDGEVWEIVNELHCPWSNNASLN